MVSRIRSIGYDKVGVFSDDDVEPYFSYTIGLFHRYQHPELVVFGLDVDVEFAILDSVVSRVSEGGEFSPGVRDLDTLDNYPIAFFTFSPTHYDQYLGQAEGFYRSTNFPVLMLIWPDRDGIFPWMDNAGGWLVRRQPRLWE